MSKPSFAQALVSEIQGRASRALRESVKTLLTKNFLRENKSRIYRTEHKENTYERDEIPRSFR